MREEGQMPEAGTNLIINTTTRRLQHFKGDKLVETYPVAVGKPSTPTPTGHYKVVNKVVNPGGVLGTRWMGLSIPNGNYGIHGTSNPSSIGTYASAGCIRMYNKDVEKLFPQVAIGAPVTITRAGVQPPAGPAINESGKAYTVKSGDTLWKISQQFGVSLDALIMINNLTNPDMLQQGQTIIIP